MYEQPVQSDIASHEGQMQQDILSQVLSLPLNPNQRQIADSRVRKALADFPDKPRAAYLLAKKISYRLTPEELEELRPYCFFPEEHPNKAQFIKERKAVVIPTGSVEVVNENPDPDCILDEVHLATIERTLTRVAARAPKIAGRLLKIFIINRKGTEQEEYGPNGKCTKRQCDDSPTGIILTQQGYRTDMKHRIAGVNNLEGTLVHELGHIIPYLYPDFEGKWSDRLEYCNVVKADNELSDGWERYYDEQNSVTGYQHRPTGMKSRDGYVAKDLSLLPSNYACFFSTEDITESFVAWVFDRPLDERRKQLFNNPFLSQ